VSQFFGTVTTHWQLMAGSCALELQLILLIHRGAWMMIPVCKISLVGLILTHVKTAHNTAMGTGVLTCCCAVNTHATALALGLQQLQLKSLHHSQHVAQLHQPQHQQLHHLLPALDQMTQYKYAQFPLLGLDLWLLWELCLGHL
jgi:hypothetical protein